MGAWDRAKRAPNRVGLDGWGLASLDVRRKRGESTRPHRPAHDDQRRAPRVRRPDWWPRRVARGVQLARDRRGRRRTVCVPKRNRMRMKLSMTMMIERMIHGFAQRFHSTLSASDSFRTMRAPCREVANAESKMTLARPLSMERPAAGERRRASRFPSRLPHLRERRLWDLAGWAGNCRRRMGVQRWACGPFARSGPICSTGIR